MVSIELLYITSVSQAYFFKLFGLKISSGGTVVIKATKSDTCKIQETLESVNQFNKVRVVKINDPTGTNIVARIRSILSLLVLSKLKKPKSIGYFNFYDICSSFSYAINPNSSCYLIDDGTATISAQIDFISKSNYIYPSKVGFINKIQNWLTGNSPTRCPPTLVTQFSLNSYLLDNQNIHIFKQKSEPIVNLDFDLCGIVGSPYSESKLMSLEDELFLISHIKALSPSCDIVYLGHPRDGNKKLTAIRSMGILVDENSKPIEDMYAERQERLPGVLFGGYSTALFSIKSRFKNVDVHAIDLSRLLRFGTRGSVNFQTLRAIYLELEKVGVKIHDT